MKNEKMTAQEFLNMERETKKTAEEWRDFFVKEKMLLDIERLKGCEKSRDSLEKQIYKTMLARRHDLNALEEAYNKIDELEKCVNRLRGRNIWHRIINKGID